MSEEKKLTLTREADVTDGNYKYYIMEGTKCLICMNNKTEEEAIKRYEEVLHHLREMKLDVEIIKEEII